MVTPYGTPHPVGDSLFRHQQVHWDCFKLSTFWRENVSSPFSAMQVRMIGIFWSAFRPSYPFIPNKRTKFANSSKTFLTECRFPRPATWKARRNQFLADGSVYDPWLAPKGRDHPEAGSLAGSSQLHLALLADLSITRSRRRPIGGTLTI